MDSRRSSPSRSLSLIALVALAIASCTARHREGEECVFNGDCDDPLVCAARSCRLACRTDRDCVNGNVCRPSGEIALRVCLPPEAPWRCASAEDCVAPLVCGPTRECQPQCRVDYDCRFSSYQSRCAKGVCVAADASIADADDAASDATEPGDSTVSVDASDATIDGARDAVTLDGAGIDARTGDGALSMDGGDATAPPRDAMTDATSDRPTLPTYSFLDVPPYDATRPAVLRGFFTFSRACAIRDDGRTFCWGPNPYGSLGISPSMTVVSTPTEVPALNGAAEVCIGTESVCARMTDGSVRCAGRNNGGQLGNGTFVDSTTFLNAVGVAGATSLRCGEHNYCALLGDGTVRCWGLNSAGQVGDGNLDPLRATPASPRGLAGVTEIAVDANYACALLSDGTERCWGANSAGSLGVGTTDSGFNTPVAVMGLTDLVHISVGGGTSCALQRDGTAWCWGSNLYQAVGDGSRTNAIAPVRLTNLPPDVRSIETAGHATCVVHGASRNVSCFGMEPLGDGPAVGSSSTITPRQAYGLADITRLTMRSTSISSASFVASRADSTQLTWGQFGAGVFVTAALSLGVPTAVEIP